MSRKMPFLLILLFCCSTLVYSQAQKIAIGPYVQNVTWESAVICWATLSGESRLIGPDGQPQTIPEYQHHELILGDLEPNTTYTYDVLGDGSPEGMGSFTTFPRKPTPFRFAVIGDTRSRHDVHRKNVEAIMREEPLFVINTGDLVGDGLNIHHWEKFFEINRELMRHTPYYAVLGNHENDSPYFYDFFSLPGNERNYTFVIGDALFIVLDTEGPNYETPLYVKKEYRDYFWNHYNLDYLKKQKEWVEHILTLHKDAGFIFVFFHEPLFSAKKSRVEGTKQRRAFWGDIFERHGVQVVLNGHDHHYHHAFHGGTHYVTTAGGGAGLYDTDAPQPETVKIAKVEHFVLVDVGLERARLRAIDINGQLIEEFEVAKRKEK